MNDRIKWTDDRIDDLADITRGLRHLPGEMSERMARFEVRQESMKEDVRDLWVELNALKTNLASGRRALVYTLLGLTGTMMATFATILYALVSSSG